MLSGGDFGQIRAFVAVGEALSFSRAAAHIGVSASALSQLIRGLEARVGVRLVNRTTRSVALTEAGAALFARARPAVLDLDAALDDSRRAAERPAGVVRIHAFRGAGEALLAPMLAGFAERFPDVVLDITLDDAVVDFVAGGYDAAIRIGEVVARDLVAVRLGPDMRQIVVATPAYLARHGAPQTPRDLAGHRCIRWRWPGQTRPYDWEFFADGAWFAVAVEGSLIVNSQELALAAALVGAGLAFMTERRAAPHVAEGHLLPLLSEWSAPFPGFFLCYPRQRHMAPALRAFIDAIRAQAASVRPRATQD